MAKRGRGSGADRVRRQAKALVLRALRLVQRAKDKSTGMMLDRLHNIESRMLTAAGRKQARTSSLRQSLFRERARAQAQEKMGV